MPIDASIQQCEHVKATGLRCGSPAMRDKAHCFFHNRLLNQPTTPIVLSIEDPNEVQIAIGRILQMLQERSLDVKRAGSMLYALQLAITNMKRADLTSAVENIVEHDPAFEIAADPLAVEREITRRRKEDAAREQKNQAQVESSIQQLKDMGHWPGHYESVDPPDPNDSAGAK